MVVSDISRPNAKINVYVLAFSSAEETMQILINKQEITIT
jgi:hypothetical protein